MRSLFFFFFLIALLGIQSCTEDDAVEQANPFALCVDKADAGKLQVATMNLQEFPKNGKTTMRMVGALIQQMDVDVIALQEISNKNSIDELVKELKGWSGLFTPAASGSMSLAYLYKNSEVELVANSAEALFTADYDFPRSPFKIKIRHKPTGEEVYLINLHLKAMSDSESVNRRKESARKLKQYMDENMSNDKVLVLGDYNDRISASGSQTFYTFVGDAANYRFADMHIATGSTTWYSYPSWPSHLDHILVTDELFSAIDTVMVYRPEICVPEYRSVVSDHRPVVAFFN